jgi:hypothetical protein
MRNLFAVVSFILLTLCFGILFLAVFFQVDDIDRQFTRLFALFFAGSTISVWAFLKLDNDKTNNNGKRI